VPHRSAPAILFGERWWTYGELADAVAARQVAMAESGGVEAPPVAAVMPNAPESVVTVLAALTQGVCLVPLSPRRPDADLEHCPPVAMVISSEGTVEPTGDQGAAGWPGAGLEGLGSFDLLVVPANTPGWEADWSATGLAMSRPAFRAS